MLFQLSPNTPRFKVFKLLNKELLYFVRQSVAQGKFRRALFSKTPVGQACWDNARINHPRSTNDLTRDKFEKLFTSLQGVNQNIRQQLLNTFRHNQNLKVLFKAPNHNLLGFLPPAIETALKNVTTHLYCATKDIQSIINVADGVSITSHFNLFRHVTLNGNICKACGMKELAAFRADVPDGKQWRADYDHQLCKSKYPIFAVHPHNLIPLCDVCNQDAKKAKDLFRHENGRNRFAFYPYAEEAKDLVDIRISALRDPEPAIKVVWTTHDAMEIDKLNTWDEIYEIRHRVEGSLRSLEVIIQDYINPRNLAHCQARINDEARPVADNTLKRKKWAFWHQKLFYQLNLNDIAPFWEKSQFANQQAVAGGNYILAGYQAHTA